MTDCYQTIKIIDFKQRGITSQVSFSNGYTIRVGRRTLERLGLAEGAEFAPEEFEKLREILEWEWAYYTAESMLARRAYSVGGFRQRLRLKGIAVEHINRIVTEFREKGFLNDYKYALARGQSLVNQKPVGKAYVIAWLQKRSVPHAVAQQAVEELFSGVDEVETAVLLLTRKRAGWAKFDLETTRQKAYTYLLRRAISYDAARQAFDKVFGSATDKTR
jgi:SOS response regulatory protein OraA/RecX